MSFCIFGLLNLVLMFIILNLFENLVAYAGISYQGPDKIVECDPDKNVFPNLELPKTNFLHKNKARYEKVYGHKSYKNEWQSRYAISPVSDHNRWFCWHVFTLFVKIHVHISDFLRIRLQSHFIFYCSSSWMIARVHFVTPVSI